MGLIDGFEDWVLSTDMLSMAFFDEKSRYVDFAVEVMEAISKDTSDIITETMVDGLCSTELRFGNNDVYFLCDVGDSFVVANGAIFFSAFRLIKTRKSIFGKQKYSKDLIGSISKEKFSQFIREKNEW